MGVDGSSGPCSSLGVEGMLVVGLDGVEWDGMGVSIGSMYSHCDEGGLGV
jgi:hypothetical protein